MTRTDKGDLLVWLWRSVEPSCAAEVVETALRGCPESVQIEIMTKLRDYAEHGLLSNPQYLEDGRRAEIADAVAAVSDRLVVVRLYTEQEPHGTFAVAETACGRRFKYGLEFSDTWRDLADYLDNVGSDFANESDAPDFGQDESGLFYEIPRLCHKCEYSYFPFAPTGDCEHPDNLRPHITPASPACELFEWSDAHKGVTV